MLSLPDEMEKVDLSQVEVVEWDEILKEGKLDFIVGAEQLKKVLKIIGNDIDDEGYITANGKRVLANDEGEIRASAVGAILPGSKVFIKKNVAGFSQYLFEYEDR